MTQRGIALVLTVSAFLCSHPDAIRSADDANAESPAYWKPAQAELASLGDGFLVWESRRNADHNWSIWTIALDGSGLRQLSPREDGREQVSPHISPDGTRVAYLSRPPKPDGTKSPLHLVNRDGSGDRVIAANAGNYSGWDRAVVWFNTNELVFINADDGSTYRLDLTSGAQTLLIEHSGGGSENPCWLPSPKLNNACWAFNSFSPLDAATHKVAPLPHLGGCQPYYTSDGLWGFWMRAPGGPMGKMFLPTRQTSGIFEANDLMPRNRTFVYFPMISDTMRLLAFGAADNQNIIGGYCGGEESDYEIFLLPLDPRTLTPLGFSKPVRYTFDPKTDRFPDVWQADPPLGYHDDKAPYIAHLAQPDMTGSWTWDFGEPAAQPANPALPTAGVATPETGTGQHLYTRPGVYRVSARQGDRMLRGLVNLLGATPPKALVAFLTTAEKGSGDNEITVLFNEPVDCGKTVCSLQSGVKITRCRLDADGRALRIAVESRPPAGDWLTLKDVLDRAQRPNRMEEVKLVVQPSAMSANLTAAASRKAALKCVAEARLVETSKFPLLQRILPYTEALTVNEYEVQKVLSGDFDPGKRIRVVHWAIRTRRPLAISQARTGEVLRLPLEQYKDHAELESLLLCDTLALDNTVPLFYCTAADKLDDTQRQWQLLGPFPNEGRKGFDVDYGPESGIDLSRGYPGAGGEVKWKTVHVDRAGYVDLYWSFRPNEYVCAYALAYVKSPNARKAIFSVGADDGVKAFLNSKVIVSENVTRAASPAQDQVDVELQEGWNAVLLKITQGSGGWGFFFDLLGTDGRPMSDVTWATSRETK